MTIEMESVGTIPNDVHPADDFVVTMDISTWLSADTIASIVYTAIDEDGTDVSTTVLDATGHSHTTTVISVNIKGGTHDVWYMVKLVVTTAAPDVKTFYLKFHCYDHSEEV